ncbi:MAG: trypsin-like peptidase domain-containing protein [Planctomycetota bacterium]|nr:trypsin-like peptidase domain-containing protein [Planctomycetota bacterium]
MRYRSRILAALALAIAIGPNVFNARAAGPDSINLRKTIVVQVVADTKAAVVNISTTKIVTAYVNPFGNDPFFHQFQVPQTATASSLGSGFIVHEDGYVVTNNHVIDRAREITVELDDGRKLPAELISADPEADLAVLKISDKRPFPAISLGDSSDLMIGEPAIAIGNPLGYSHSVSTGIVSAVHRELKDDKGQVIMGNLIQTDAAINPGNSGGPLLNAYGQVIAINTAIRSDAQNIGFAIPINRLRELIPELMNPAQAKKLDVPVKLTERRILTQPDGIRCEILTTDSPQRVVKSIDGKEPRNIIDAYDILLTARAGHEITLEFAQGSAVKVIPKATPMPDAIVQAKHRLGITLEQMTPALADKTNAQQEDGLYIDAVASGSIADRAGVRPGDILVQMGRYRIATLDDLAALLHRLPDAGRVRIGVIRDNALAFGLLEMGI